MAINVKFQKVFAGFVFGLVLLLVLSACTPRSSAPAQSHAASVEAQEMVVKVKEQPEYIRPECMVSDDVRAYRLGADDEIVVNVFGEKELSGPHKLGPKGAVAVPLVGEVALMGCTTRQAEKILIDLYKDGYLVDPSISVQISKYRPFFILGEVRNPGQYEYSSDLTVRKAAALAGGFTYRADERNILVLRQQDSLSSTSKVLVPDSRVYPGDVLTVQEQFF